MAQGYFLVKWSKSGTSEQVYAKNTVIGSDLAEDSFFNIEIPEYAGQDEIIQEFSLTGFVDEYTIEVPIDEVDDYLPPEDGESGSDDEEE